MPKQVNPIYADPVRAKMIITLEIGENEVKTATPIKPIPPNFNKIEARIIDPIIGVSTWASGSHKWVIKIGNFTKNANSYCQSRKPIKSPESMVQGLKAI